MIMRPLGQIVVIQHILVGKDGKKINDYNYSNNILVYSTHCINN